MCLSLRISVQQTQQQKNRTITQPASDLTTAKPIQPSLQQSTTAAVVVLLNNHLLII